MKVFVNCRLEIRHEDYRLSVFWRLIYTSRYQVIKVNKLHQQINMRSIKENYMTFSCVRSDVQLNIYQLM